MDTPVYNITCPVCKKSVLDPQKYEKAIDKEITTMAMPDEYKDVKINILCNDCLEKSEVPFHAIATKCSSCRSYNTT